MGIVVRQRTLTGRGRAPNIDEALASQFSKGLTDPVFEDDPRAYMFPTDDNGKVITFGKENQARSEAQKYKRYFDNRLTDAIVRTCVEKEGNRWTFGLRPGKPKDEKNGEEK